MTVLKKISVINENKSSKYSILIGNNFIKTLEKNFSKTLKGKKIYVIYDEFFHKLQLHKNLIKDFEKVSTKLGASMISKLLFVCTSTPMPGLVRLAMKSPKKIAIDVVPK